MYLKYIVEIDNIMVKEYLEHLGLSRNMRRKIKNHDMIFINGLAAKNYFLLRKNDLLEITIIENLNENLPINESPLQIEYEDNDFLIIVKPANLSSQPSRKHPNDNIISIVKNYFLKNNIESNIHVITRLDYQTTGLMIIAKNGLVHHSFSNIEIIKEYLCVVMGEIKPPTGVIDLPIARYQPPDIRRFISNEGKRAITIYQTLMKNDSTSVLKVRLKTGRTHQIRVHLAHIGYPIQGDALYGQKENLNLKLHCFHLSFLHPINNQIINIYNYPEWYQGGNIDA